MKRVLDKIRFIRSFPKSAGLELYNAHIDAAFKLVGDGELKRIHDPDSHQTVLYKKYKGVQEENPLRLSFGSYSKGAYIAVEVTPYKLTDSEWEDVRSYFSTIFDGAEVVASNFRLFEVELAVDMSQPMSDFIFIAPKLRVQEVSNFSTGEIRRLGSKQGNQWIRIYDKKKQLAKKKGVHIQDPRTRIEFVIRRLSKTLVSCFDLPNPFGGIVVVPRAQIPEIRLAHPTDYGLRHFCKIIEKGGTGHSAYWSIEDADMRKEIIKRLRPFALDLAGKQSDWNQWVSSELAYLKARFKAD